MELPADFWEILRNCARRGGDLCSRWRFSKISLLLNLPLKITVLLTFVNLKTNPRQDDEAQYMYIYIYIYVDGHRPSLPISTFSRNSRKSACCSIYCVKWQQSWLLKKFPRTRGWGGDHLLSQQKFLKVSSLLNLLYEILIELTFEKKFRTRWRDGDHILSP